MSYTARSLDSTQVLNAITYDGVKILGRQVGTNNLKIYQASDSDLSTPVTTARTTTSTSYVTTGKSITILTPIHPLSTFRIHILGRHMTAGKTAYLQIRLNGAELFTDTNNTGSSTNYTHDIPAGTLEKGDVLEVFYKVDPDGTAQCSNLILEGSEVFPSATYGTVADYTVTD